MAERHSTTGELEAEAQDLNTQDNSTAQTGDGQPAAELDLMKIQAGFGFMGPIAMRMLAEEKAAEAKLPLGTYLRNLTANAIGFALPAEKARATGLSAEEKKAKEDEAKAKAKEERERITAALEANRVAKGIAKPKATS